MTTTPEFGAQESTDDKKRLMVLGGLAAALLLGAGGYMLLSGGGGEEDLSLGLPSSSKPKTIKPATGTSTTKAPKAQLVPAPSSVKLGRDPFLALYIPPAPVVAAPQTGSGVAAPSSGGGTTAGGGQPAEPAAPATYALVLNRVYGEDANQTGVFSVKGKQQLARVGSVFGATQELKLLSLQQDEKGRWVATIQVGDSEPFDATAGQVYGVL